MGAAINRLFLCYLMWMNCGFSQRNNDQKAIPVAGGWSHIPDGTSEWVPFNSNHYGMF